MNTYSGEGIESLEQKLKAATVDAKSAIEAATELALNHWGKAHETADSLRVDVAKAKVALRDASPEMKGKEIDDRIQATDLYREFLRAEHKVKRIEELIKVAKAHAKLSNGY